MNQKILMAQEILGLKPGAAAEDVSVAFRNLAVKYHPDKVASLGNELKEPALKFKSKHSSLKCSK